MNIDTQDLSSYIPGYDDYVDDTKPVYSTSEYYDMKELLESEIEDKEEIINDLLDKCNLIKDKLDEIKNKDYITTKDDIKYIEEILKEDK